LMRISAVVAWLGNAPRYVQRLPVLDLFLDRRFAGIVKQGVFVVGHQEQGHQIFKHRPAPGDENRFTAWGHEQAAKRKPMVLRNLPLRDGDITAQTRLRSEKVIETEVAPAFGDVEPDGEQL